MKSVKGPHHRGRYHVAAAHVRAQAYANPLTTCWRCNRTLTEIQQLKPQAHWTAGHLIDGDPSAPLLAECSPCNYGQGARIGNAKRTPRPNVSRQW